MIAFIHSFLLILYVNSIESHFKVTNINNIELAKLLICIQPNKVKLFLT